MHPTIHEYLAKTRIADLHRQAQRPGQQHSRVLAGGAVDAPLQVTDRPLAHPRGLGQLVLGQPGIGPQLPQQPPETQSTLLGHRPVPPRPARRQSPPGRGAGTASPQA